MNIAKTISYNEKEVRMSSISRRISINSKPTLYKAQSIIEEESKKLSFIHSHHLYVGRRQYDKMTIMKYLEELYREHSSRNK